MTQFSLPTLQEFIVRTKRTTYVGSGKTLLPYRLGSHDLQFEEGVWAYHDSYFGDADFLGQEVVYYDKRAVWGMNYFGRILSPDHISAAQASQVIRISLSALYQEGRFLGGFRHTVYQYTYVDTNTGDVSYFEGTETILREEQTIYQLIYHGGLIK